MVLDNINISLSEGTTCILGETGSGKTTLARLIVGLETPTKGDIYFFDKKMPPLRKRSFADCAAIQYIFQDPYSALDKEATVGEVLNEPYKICKRHKFSRVLTPKEALEVVGIKNHSEWFKKRIATLSGGQKQKICIARAIVPIPRLIIADESTSMLDMETAEEVLDILDTIKTQFNIALLIITHQLKIVERGYEKVYILKDGRIIEEGNSQKILTNPMLNYTKELVEAMKLFGGGK